mgnify:CR=1 FL=1
MAKFYVMEAVNLFCGNHDPSTSKHLTIQTLRLPVLEEKTAEHGPGGSVAAVTLGMGQIAPLDITFKLNGYDPDMLSLFGVGGRKIQPYTAYGVVRNKLNSKAIESKTIVHGKLGRIEPDEIQRGELSGHDHTIIEVMHYELYFDDKEKFFFNFANQIWRVDGVSQNADERRILRIPGAA